MATVRLTIREIREIITEELSDEVDEETLKRGFSEYNKRIKRLDRWILEFDRHIHGDNKVAISALKQYLKLFARAKNSKQAVVLILESIRKLSKRQQPATANNISREISLLLWWAAPIPRFAKGQPQIEQFPLSFDDFKRLLPTYRNRVIMIIEFINQRLEKISSALPKIIRYLKKNPVLSPGELKKMPGAESPDDVFGAFAFPNDRVKPMGFIEPDTPTEDEMLDMINQHFDEDIPLKGKSTALLRSLLKQGKYADVLKEPDVDIVYRGMRLSPRSLETLLARGGVLVQNLADSGKFTREQIISHYRGKHDVNLMYESILGRDWASSWSSSLHQALKFGYIILKARVSDNPNMFLDCNDAIYKLSVPATFKREQEIISLGNVKVFEIIVKKPN